jgi:hypothetical protein
MWIIDPLVTLGNPHYEIPTRLFTLEVFQARECTPTPYPFVFFTFWFTVESIKEFGGVSIGVLPKKIGQKKPYPLFECEKVSMAIN